MDFEMFNQVRPLELANFRWVKKDASSESPHVWAFVQRFNQVPFYDPQCNLTFVTCIGRSF